MTHSERQPLIEKIRHLPAQAEKTINGLNDAQLNTPYGEGKWTPRQIIHHIADSHLNAFVRMKLILTEPEPLLTPYDQDEWAKLPDVNLPPDSSLAMLRGLHTRWSTLFENLSDSDWTRRGKHPEYNEPYTIEKILSLYAWHGEHHLEQITKLSSEKGW